MIEGVRRAVLIAGPTGSGKSALALEFARKRRGTIVNADAMQVYRELRVLTARPTEAEETVVPHRLYGHVPAAEAHSAGRWLEEAKRVLDETWNTARVPIIVGGTGLYFRALEQGFAAVPPIADEVRAHWRRALAERGAEALHAELARLAPDEAARLRPSDGQRIVRALEVLDGTGEPLSSHQARGGVPSPLAGARVERLLLMPERAALHRRCEERFLRMIEAGALDEVRYLLALNLDPALPAMKAIGVRPLARHLAGELSLEHAVALAQQETRQYVKRQLTWIRRYMADWRLVNQEGQLALDL
jgi:tRNA dimethylallyltransferase